MNTNASIPHFSDLEFNEVVIRQLDQSKEGYPTAKRVVCKADHARRILNSLASLTEGEQARCHTPAFAVDLLNGEEVVFSANICWSCNNMQLSGTKALSNWATFDATSPAAKLLFAVCIEAAKEV